MYRITTFICLLVSMQNSVFGTLRIVSTAALIDYDFENRKKEYILSIAKLKKFGYNPYIIEAILGKGPSFLDNYCKNVFYSKAHDFNVTDIRNKGINEARTLLDGLNHFNFAPDDMILKMTGRYWLKSDKFIKLVKSNPAIDVFVKFIHNPSVISEFNPEGNWAITGCFAMRCSLMREMLEGLDYKAMEKNFSYIEHELYNYLRKKVDEGSEIKIKRVETLDLKARVLGDGTYLIMEF